MLGIGPEIKRRREALGWTQIKLATLAGVTPPTISRLESGKTHYGPETLSQIAGALGVSAERLFVSQSNVEYAEIGSRRVPLLDYIQAGQWTGVRPDRVDGEMQETVVTDLEHPPSSFAMRIRGESMEPEFHAGDVVVINPTLQAKPGDCVVATDGSGEATFKQYRDAGRNQHGLDVFELWPLNPLYGPMRSDRQQLAIVGVMVEHRRFRRR